MVKKTEEPEVKSVDQVGVMIPREISQEMQESYLDYAMSVIVSRALPDVRDGLKPVHRRVLYSMWEQGIRAGAKYRKSAKVVGDVLAKYHPHGDIAVYDTLVRMAQSFSLRYPLVDGQGNFGSMDGDSAAHMRYTEAKMTKIAEELMFDTEKETVNFRPNYDATEQEPIVLPAKIPNLLLNGVMGIAVGMATNIPPHNLNEVVEAICYLASNPECNVEELLKFIKGPDFPTGGLVYDGGTFKEIYSTGRGSVVMRARAEIEETKNGKCRILVTEIPYQVNKSALITKMAELVQNKKIVGITDIRDESNKEGVRVVIEIKKDGYPKKILNQLYKYTQLQENFGFNMVALVERGLQPQLLNLKSLLEYFLLHRHEVVTRRTQYELKIAEARAHILEGLKIALDNIDAVIKTIKSSATKEEAKENLIAKFKLTELQAEAILQMRLQTLAGLEKKKIEDELAEKLALIGELKSILADPEKIKRIILDELGELKKNYGDARRTEVVAQGLDKISATDTIPNEEMVVTLTREGYIKRVIPSSYHSQRRGGKGIVGMTTKEEDEILQLLVTKNLNELFFFTNTGRVFKLPAYEIPQASRQAKGQNVINLLNLQEGERVAVVLDLTLQPGKHLFMATKLGQVKKTPLDEFTNVRSSGIRAMGLKEGDELLWVRPTDGEEQVMLITTNGLSIRFSEKDVRPMGRGAAGVRGIRLKGDDQVVSMGVARDPKEKVLSLSEKGFGKLSSIVEYRLQGRGGSGIKAAIVSRKTGKIVGARILPQKTEGDLLIVSSLGQMIRIKLKEVPARSRVTQGVYIMRLAEGDRVAGISVIEKEKEEMVLAEKSTTEE